LASAIDHPFLFKSKTTDVWLIAKLVYSSKLPLNGLNLAWVMLLTLIWIN